MKVINKLKYLLQITLLIFAYIYGSYVIFNDSWPSESFYKDIIKFQLIFPCIYIIRKLVKVVTQHNPTSEVFFLSLSLIVFLTNVILSLHPSYVGSALLLIGILGNIPLISLFLLFFLTNKSSVLGITVYLILKKIDSFSKVNFIIIFAIIVATATYIYSQTFFWFNEFNISNIHTISHRISIIENLWDIIQDYSFMNLMFSPIPSINISDQAFDNGYIVAISRYGIFISMVYFYSISVLMYKISGYPAVVASLLLFVTQPFLLHPYLFIFFILSIILLNRCSKKRLILNGEKQLFNKSWNNIKKQYTDNLVR